MKCFISYSYNTDISVIKRVLEDKNISFISPIESLEYGNAVLQAINRQIKDCDFVVAVLDGSTNVAFEIGLAMGVKKPVFAISLDNKKKPIFLEGLIYTIAEPTNYEKINYSFEIFYNNLPKRKEKITSSILGPKSKTKKEFKGKLLEEGFVNSITNLDKISGFEFEELIATVLKKLDLEIFTQNKTKEKDFYADFSLWLDDLNSTIGNPIIIEAKSTSNQHRINQAIENLSFYLTKYNAKVALLIYNNPNNVIFEIKTNYSPLVIGISIQELIQQLTEKTLSEVIINLRNVAVHKSVK